MIDTDSSVTPTPRCSTFDRLPSGFSGPDANDLDRLAASLDGLALCCCEPGADGAGEHSGGGSVGTQQRFGEAAPIDGEQL